MSKENVLSKADITFLLLSPLFCNKGSHTDDDLKGFQGGQMPPVQMPFFCLGICLPYEFWWREEIVEAESAESQFPDVPGATTGALTQLLLSQWFPARGSFAPRSPEAMLADP